MDPISAFLVSNAGAIAAVSGGVGAIGSFMQGGSAASGYNQQAEASERNAGIAENQARQAYDAGLQNELGQRRSASQQQADIRASVAESGLDPNSGSALMLQQQSAENLEMDALTTRYQTLLQGSAYEQQATMDRYQAKALRASARDAKRSGMFGAATSILTSAAGYGLSKLAPVASTAAGSGVRVGGGVGLRVGNVAQYWR